MTVTIDEYKKILEKEFNITEFFDDDTNLKRSFNLGTILLTPSTKLKQRNWLKKAVDEWERGGRTILILTTVRFNCKYFSKYINQVSETRLLLTQIEYKDHKSIKPMVLAIYKEKPLREINHLVNFN
jgi:hypothetical protein